MNGNDNRKTVAVAMSGGVDSSVAAALLAQSDYRVIGLTMRLWDFDSSLESMGAIRGCCSGESITQAQRVCDKLEIPHYVIDFRQEFRHWVMDDFVSEYFKGRTPNPCVRCNTYLKWQALWRKAEGLGADFLATGHYARIIHDREGWKLYRATDSSKDQSYALWGIPRAQLATILFPLGDQIKRKVRHIARNLGFSNAETPDSQDICFLFGEKYQDFLKTHYPDRFAALQPGKIVDESGEVLGEHEGYVGYTVGQRKGLKVSAAERLFVLRTEPENNEVVIGTAKSLEVQGLEAIDLNWVSIPPPDNPFPATIQVRYRDHGVPGTVVPKGDKVSVRFDHPHRGIAPGQSVVFYNGDCLLGGGIILKSIAEAT
jgi:tRNA-specific 2-thiouridylase